VPTLEVSGGVRRKPYPTLRVGRGSGSNRYSAPARDGVHHLRHSGATWLVPDGVPLNDIAKVMGREQTSTTPDRYTDSTHDRDQPGAVIVSSVSTSLRRAL
jgi:integrase